MENETSKNERPFKTEILEIPNPDNSEIAQMDLSENRNNDKAAEISHGDGNRNAAPGSDEVRTESEITRNTNEVITSESEKSQGEETQEPEIKRGRGRPRKDENSTVIKTENKTENNKTEKPKIADAKNDLLKDLAGFKTASLGASTPAGSNTDSGAPKIDISKYISGALLLMVMDSIFPGIILMIAGWVDPKYKRVKAAQLKLEPSEKKELEPLADEVVKVIFGHVNPIIAFFIATGAIYAGKLLLLDEDDFKKPRKSEIEETEKIIANLRAELKKKNDATIQKKKR